MKQEGTVGIKWKNARPNHSIEPRVVNFLALETAGRRGVYLLKL